MANQFGIGYQIIRVSLLIFLALMVVLNVVGLLKSLELSHIVWTVVSFVSIIIGLIGAIKEHFLYSLIFTIISIILSTISVWVGLFYGSAGAALLLVIVSLIYTFMLYDSGRRQTSFVI
uniref:Uncharacterized protein LOC113794899 n=1 Tax=Dermatophagoides pteronyssinus TaxID=6956 RepID=A0A6P6Y6C4_DERPT|nr:uncharacterized protein LOC113794899 [Dermatophagoides pteronyssinus]